MILQRLWTSFGCLMRAQSQLVRFSSDKYQGTNLEWIPSQIATTRCISSHSSPKICETSDKKHVVCFHPTNSFAYENTKPIPRPDPSLPGESVEGILKVKFRSEKWKKERDGPSPEELGKMFYTTKHRWFPIGIRRRMARRIQPPRDRPYL